MIPWIKKEYKNPISKLNQYLRESENEVKKVEKLIERQYLLKEEFARELKQTEYMAEKKMSTSRNSSSGK